MKITRNKDHIVFESEAGVKVTHRSWDPFTFTDYRAETIRPMWVYDGKCIRGYDDTHIDSISWDNVYSIEEATV